VTWWAWPLTPLTSRVIGATFCLGAAGLVVLWDARWIAVRLMLEVQIVMFALIFVAAVRGRSEFLTDRPMTWLLGVGFAALFAASVGLWLRHPSKHGAARSSSEQPEYPGVHPDSRKADGGWG
jgi:hypothetical protein